MIYAGVLKVFPPESYRFPRFEFGICEKFISKHVKFSVHLEQRCLAKRVSGKYYLHFTYCISGLLFNTSFR